MLVWGGLRPIIGQVAVDTLALFGFGISTTTKLDQKNGWILMSTAIVVLMLSGNLTNKWTIIFPMLPFLILQGSRRIFSNRWITCTICILSLLLIVLAGLLSILFPAVELPPTPDAPYNVGVIDVFLPVTFVHSPTLYYDGDHNNEVKGICPTEQDHVSVRILYPTREGPGSVPHFRPEISKVFCEETMMAGAPPPLKPFSWMIHMWQLSHWEAKYAAQPLHGSSHLPLIAFSHGLGGNADLYSYQTRALAGHGYVVVVIDHTDGSASVVPRKDGSILRRNDTFFEFEEWDENLREKHRRGRRAMTEYRSGELLAAVDAMLDLNTRNIPELEQLNVSFVGTLDTQEIHYMGHSFGGATSFHAAGLRPPTSIIAHEPISIWIPDATRASLFEASRLKGVGIENSYLAVDAIDDSKTSIHDVNMLVLFSHEWEKNEWGGVEVFHDLHQRGLVGPKEGASKVAVISGAHHSAFSDTCMLTPIWLARATGITGERNPLDTAREIHDYTLNFLKDVRKRKKA